MVQNPTSAFDGLHLSFGGDAAHEMTASWATRGPLQAAGATATHPSGRGVEAIVTTRSYTDALSGVTVHGHHAEWSGLEPATTYTYEIASERADDPAGPGLAERTRGTFTTGPSGRAPVTFTAFGDQGAPPIAGDDGLPLPGGGLGSPIVVGTTAAVEAAAPDCHLLVGDLAYSNLAEDRVHTWERFWQNTSRSARHRPWLCAPGNHENEFGNGALGYDGYRTYVAAPPTTGQPADATGLWYAVTLGSVRIVMLHGDDLALQDGGDHYVHGYSGGAQLAWLKQELTLARADDAIDWVVVGVHQIALGTVDRANGADLGLRRAFFPLCDAYDVDLVISGHDHHYERSHPVRGHADNDTWTPIVAARDPERVDARAGTVHVVVGTGGTSSPTHGRFFDPPACRVITRVGELDPGFGRRPPVYRTEPADWVAFRDAAHPYGFLSGRVDPGDGPGATTTLTVSFHEVLDEQGTTRLADTVTLSRPRRDGPAGPRPTEALRAAADA